LLTSLASIVVQSQSLADAASNLHRVLADAPLMCIGVAYTVVILIIFRCEVYQTVRSVPRAVHAHVRHSFSHPANYNVPLTNKSWIRYLIRALEISALYAFLELTIL